MAKLALRLPLRHPGRNAQRAAQLRLAVDAEPRRGFHRLERVTDRERDRRVHRADVEAPVSLERGDLELELGRSTHEVPPLAEAPSLLDPLGRLGAFLPLGNLPHVGHVGEHGRDGPVDRDLEIELHGRRLGCAAMRVSFLVPAYNEAATIEALLDAVWALELEKQIVVVDDGSTDATGDIVERWREGRKEVVLVSQQNRGKGAAVRAAIPHADGDISVIQDADLEYDPADVPALIEPIERGIADVVYGSRLSGGRPQRAYLFWHLVGNRFLSLLTNVLYNTTLSDMETGYKAFRTEVLRSLDLRQDDFGIEPEITAKVCKRKLRVYELPIAYYGRTYAEGKKITWRDGFKAIRVLFGVRLSG